MAAELSASAREMVLRDDFVGSVDNERARDDLEYETKGTVWGRDGQATPNDGDAAGTDSRGAGLPLRLLRILEARSGPSQALPGAIPAEARRQRLDCFTPVESSLRTLTSYCLIAVKSAVPRRFDGSTGMASMVSDTTSEQREVDSVASVLAGAFEVTFHETEGAEPDAPLARPWKRAIMVGVVRRRASAREGAARAGMRTRRRRPSSGLRLNWYVQVGEV
mgnify:CR=1 FL=1